MGSRRSGHGPRLPRKDVGTLLDRQRCDETTFGCANQIDLLRLTLRCSKNADEVQEVVLTLKDCQARLVVAAGGEPESKSVDQIRNAEIA